MAMGAQLSAVDPHVVEDVRLGDALRRVALTPEEVSAADAVVLLTDHDEFDVDMVQANARFVLDTRRRLAGANVEVI